MLKPLGLEPSDSRIPLIAHTYAIAHKKIISAEAITPIIWSLDNLHQLT